MPIALIIAALKVAGPYATVATGLGYAIGRGLFG